jgi:hypothetical protein
VLTLISKQRSLIEVRKNPELCLETGLSKQKWRASYLNIGNLAPGEFELVKGNVRLLQIPEINEHE